MRRIFLIGYMGAGKTTLGKELAKSLDLDFIDLDHFIQSRFQKTVSQLFEEYGETEFRNIEKNVLNEVGELENVVISAGGGTPCFFDNMDYMNKVGDTVYLKASAAALTERLETCKEKRPLIRDKDREELYKFVTDSLANRDPHYSKARYVFQTEKLVNREEIDEYIASLLDLIKE